MRFPGPPGRKVPGAGWWRVLTAALLLAASGAVVGGGPDPAADDTAGRPGLELRPAFGEAELCCFNPADSEVHGCAIMSRTAAEVPPELLEDLREDRVYGWFIRVPVEGSRDTVYTDTLFATAAALADELASGDGRPRPTAVTATGQDHAAPRAHNFPNPFNPKVEDTEIVFEPDRSGSITMMIFDLFGFLVYEETFTEARDLRWSGRNGRGELAAAGGYICVLKMDGEIVSKHKIAVIR